MAQDPAEDIKKIQQIAKRMRQRILAMALSAGARSAHVGGALSFVEIAATLFGVIMKHDPRNPQWKERDKFILSKGHGCLGYYAILAEMGYIPEEDLYTFEKTGTYLLGHPVMNRERGIEFSTGSLGMGLSLGIGVALAAKRRNTPQRAFVILGDGECNEGSVWEAALAAPHFGLDNLTAIIDRNSFQQTGSNKDIMSVGNIAEKWKAFGWNVHEVDGHDATQLVQAFSAPLVEKTPRAIVAHTIKGKGCSFAENNNDWHHGVLTQVQYDQAIKEIDGQ